MTKKELVGETLKFLDHLTLAQRGVTHILEENITSLSDLRTELTTILSHTEEMLDSLTRYEIDTRVEQLMFPNG